MTNEQFATEECDDHNSLAVSSSIMIVVQCTDCWLLPVTGDVVFLPIQYIQQTIPIEKCGWYMSETFDDSIPTTSSEHFVFFFYFRPLLQLGGWIDKTVLIQAGSTPHKPPSNEEGNEDENDEISGLSFRIIIIIQYYHCQEGGYKMCVNSFS